MKVRLDKWLQVARAFKTRSQATRACNLGRVRVNGSIAKPHRPLALDDRIEIVRKDWSRVLIVKELRDRTLPKTEVSRIYEDISPPRPTKDPFDRIRERPGVSRESGAGRPTKRDRRLNDRWRGRE